MTEILKGTGLNPLKQGESITPREIFNPLIENSDQNTEALDEQMKGYFNLNAYLKDYSMTFKLVDAVKLIPTNRVWPGMIFRFLSPSGKYVDYMYHGKHSGVIDSESINNLLLWIPREADIIDGGVW